MFEGGRKLNAKYYKWERIAKKEEEFKRLQKQEKILLKDNFHLLIKINELETEIEELHSQLKRYSKEARV